MMKILTKLRLLTGLFIFVSLLSCKNNEELPEVKLAGKWNLMTRIYEDSTTPKDTEDYSGDGYYLDLKENNTYSVLFSGESGEGNYTVNNKEITFVLLSGDDDITDEDTFTIKTLSINELVLEAKGGSTTSGYTHELRFNR